MEFDGKGKKKDGRICKKGSEVVWAFIYQF